ncbi:hypothetical protein ACJQWY_01290 [Weissella kandleri]|uniref:hypothetical protein n=1 Tax=Weissella kandleri TaxID=1616 RepID=UPI00387E504E
MHSYGIRNVPNLPQNDFDLYNSEKGYKDPNTNPLISCKLSKKTTTINNKSYVIYDCTMNKPKTLEISVAGTIYNNYEEITNFKVLYCQSTKLTIVEENSQLSAKFFDLLSKEYNLNLNVRNYQYNFNTLRTMNSANIMQLWFKKNSTIVQNKYFQGNRIDQDTEALSALQNNTATYISSLIDINSHNKNVSRKIGLAKKGSITIINANDPNINNTNENRIFLLDVFNTLKQNNIIV